MKNLIIINYGIVVDVVQEDDDWLTSSYDKQPFDTTCEDPSKKFQVGDEYTIEKLLEYNPQSSETSTNNFTIENTQGNTEITKSDTGDIVKLTTRL